MKVVTSVDLPGFRLLTRGKVRDVYELDGASLLIVATDRMSAFDVVLTEPVPYKGVVLNQLTLFWMERFKNIIPNHLLTADLADYPAELAPYRAGLEGRSVLARKAAPLPVECIVRGYLAGSGWEEYKKSGALCGRPLPAGLAESARLPEPLFTPSTKAALGGHDENLSDEAAVALLGRPTFELIRETALELFRAAGAYALERGLILADTKFEFGVVDGQIVLIDEVLTPDSSRFWRKEGYEPGHGQPSFDKQYLRDWLAGQPWDKTPPPPALPAEVLRVTAEKYREAYRMLTGGDLPV